MKKIVLGVLVALSLNAWELEVDEENLKIYTKSVKKGVDLYKVDTTLKIDYECIKDTLTDLNLHTKVFDEIKSVNILENKDNKSYIANSQIELSFPFEPRYMRYKFKVNEHLESISIDTYLVPSEKKEGFIEVEKYHETYSITKLSDHISELNMWGEIDMGEEFSKWSQKEFVVDRAKNMLKNIDKICKAK